MLLKSDTEKQFMKAILIVIRVAKSRRSWKMLTRINPINKILQFTFVKIVTVETLSKAL